jgi:hypothetical protein
MTGGGEVHARREGHSDPGAQKAPRSFMTERHQFPSRLQLRWPNGPPGMEPKADFFSAGRDSLNIKSD